MRIDGSCHSRVCRPPTLIDSHTLSINFELVHILMRVELVGPVISSQLSCNSCSRFPGTRVEKTLMRTLASQPSCNSCSRLPGTRVKKTLVQTLPCQLSYSFAGQEKKFSSWEHKLETKNFLQTDRVFLC